ncbi:hypothetical protein [Dickeya solani]|uniref:Lipoprotein n=1 Tax=Dickeya solani TaxID=1089444 RepID=A0ABU4EK02_9GAMM|nr:hypothetical protein [Dickeya solani]MCA6999737.1 hypothetical protein [Dickeya solani]MCZ0820318.1 hypothetical protein [Dickeya solani]MDV6993948.1 hypothetical protein [Dickeya solani]MDV7005304.1 hypothetical protein [Dickeya solani]MDV7039121.1 hypothetical protein [Dickeya solani]
MFFNKKHVMAFGVCLSIFLTGCQNTSSLNNQQTSVDPRLTNNQDIEFFSKSGIQACAAGAAVGLIGCAISNSQNKAVCMAAAAIAGCGIGVGANAYLDNQRKKYATKEEQLNASILDVKNENQKLQNVSRVAKTVMADDRAVIASLNKDITAKIVDKKVVEKKLKNVDANITTLRGNLVEMKKHEQQWIDVAKQTDKNSKKAAELDAEIQKMHVQIASLQQDLDTLYTQRTALKVS